MDLLGRVAPVLLSIQALVFALRPEWVPLARPLEFLRTTPWRWLGAVLLFGAQLLLVTAQLQMGASWRIGIEEEARPGLVTHGFYAHVRNPIYTFLLLAFAGYVFLLPTWLSLVAFVVTIVELRQHVKREEEYLLRTYGDEFREYARRVGRFVPAVGRLA